MKVIRAFPHRIYPNCEIVEEVFSPEYCDKMGWTFENHYQATDTDEKVYTFEDTVEVSRAWRIYAGQNPVSPDTEVLDEVKFDKLQEMTRARNNSIDNIGAEYNGLHYYADKGSKSDIHFAITAYDKTQILPTMWKAVDGILQSPTYNDLIGIAMSVGNYIETQYTRELELINKINQAATIEGVKAITWI